MCARSRTHTWCVRASGGCQENVCPRRRGKQTPFPPRCIHCCLREACRLRSTLHVSLAARGANPFSRDASVVVSGRPYRLRSSLHASSAAREANPSADASLGGLVIFYAHSPCPFFYFAYLCSRLACWSYMAHAYDTHCLCCYSGLAGNGRYLFFRPIFFGVCPTGSHTPPLRLSGRPNRGHTNLAL